MLSLFVRMIVISSVVSYKTYVTSSSGRYRGERVKSYSGRPYYLFKGIKFAHVVERFQEAVPVGDTNEIIDALEFGPACYQNNTGYFIFNKMSEDCLYLDIYTPNLKENLPVMVFIYGGSFYEGSTQEYSGEYFMESKRIVVVIISYRVGPFGFLYLGDEYPANLGIRDQILALKWIQKNVKHFGGDPKRVTVNGQSAGGASIDIMMHSPLAKGLFIGAISESGTTCSRWGLQPTCAGIQRRNLLALFSGCFLHLPLPGFSTQGLVKCLRSKSAVEILDATQRFPIWMHGTYYPPVIESISAPNPVITKLPWFDADNSTELVPWITGVNSNEAYDIIRSSPLSKSRILQIGAKFLMEFMLPDFLYFRYTAYSPFLVTEKLKIHYFHLLFFDFLEFGNQVVNGGFFYYPMTRCLRGVKSPTYAYYFNYTQPHEEGGGVPHTRELMYSWDLIYHLRSHGNRNDIEFSKQFVETWIDFAYYQTANFSGVVWDKYNFSKDNVLIINNDGIKMGTNPSHANNSFWETLEIDTNPKNDFCIFH